MESDKTVRNPAKTEPIERRLIGAQTLRWVVLAGLDYLAIVVLIFEAWRIAIYAANLQGNRQRSLERDPLGEPHRSGIGGHLVLDACAEGIARA